MNICEAMGNTTSTPEAQWALTFKEIKCRHDAAYDVIQTAITCEENERPDQALEKYKQGIQFIDSALRVQVTCPDNPDANWEKAILMIQKMKKTRGEVLSRINTLQQSNDYFEPRENPPSYDEAMSSSTSSPQTYTDLANALKDISVTDGLEMETGIIFLYERVELYFISASGEVSSTLRPQTLKIIHVENEGENLPGAILQIGDWVYPLIPGVSPCYRSEYGAFILPNVYAETGSSIGIILPSDADPNAYELLESILYGIVGQAKSREDLKPPQDLSHKISGGLVTGASYVSRGLVAGASKLGTFINDSTPKLINRINGADESTEISPRVQRGVQIAENATYKAAKVTGYVADKVGVATVKLGQFLAPHIEKQGTRLLTNGFRMSEEEANMKMKGVMTVAAGAIEGFSTVYCGLEKSAGILGKSLKNNTVKVVEHRYGQSAGDVTGDTLNTVGNVFEISHNVKIFHPKHLAKRGAKEAGKVLVRRYSVNEGASTSGVDKKKPENDEKEKEPPSN